MENKEEIVSYLKNIKNGKVNCDLDVLNDEGEKIAILKPVIDSKLSDNSEIIRFITKWREYYAENFLTQFKVTEERTKNWLDTNLIKRDDKILFMIETRDKKVIGHIGVIFKEDYSVGELDNVIKDKNCKVPRIMTYALKALINFLFNFLELEKLTLRVFSENLNAQALYSRCGFSKDKEVGLKKEIIGEEVRYVEIGENELLTPDKIMIVMNLEKN